MNKERYLFNRNNLLYVLFLVAILGVSGYEYYKTTEVKTKNEVLVNKSSKLQYKLDKLTKQNNQIVYVPRVGDANLSKNQVKMIKFLTKFFAQMTTFSTSTEYKTNYNYAKSIINDQAFFDQFMNAPVVDGVNRIKAQNIKMKSEQVQVVITGDNSYQVFVTYVPYHNSSDLYQESELYTMTKVFDVQGTKSNITKMALNTDFVDNSLSRTVSDLKK